ncbi:TolC family protein [Sulfuricurvum sp.]|uniref:TolC family protein n=1 Tax=Sulfuricurvum sp. TaxID=2025608 RepID=UPI0026279932|nr:TolC family protein [Sulfuricurvum sp.]MDD3597849.1 TolC family protein [Sulfuricurvum sp.]
MKKAVCFSAASLLLFGGCAVTTQEAAFRSVHETVKEDLVWIKTPQEAQKVDESVRALLEKPLNEENAVRIALINNRSLQQTYEEIGIAHADLVQAGLMGNPVLGYSVGQGGGMRTNTFSIELAFLDLLWIPLRRELGTIAFEEAKLRVGDEVLRTVRETSRTFVEARTAHEIAAERDEMLKSYEASAQLAIRQYTAGNLAKRELLKIQDAYAHARMEAIKAHQNAASAQEALNTVLGVYGLATYYTYGNEKWELREPPASSEPLERLAIENRLDIAAAKKRLQYAAKEAGISENTRLLDELTLEYDSEKSTGEARFNTLGVKIPLPIFDIGQGKIGMAQARYNQSHHELYALAVNVRSEVRRSHAALRYAYDIAREYRESILVLNQGILEQTGLFYNGMLEGIYELLEDQRRLSEAKIGALEATAEYRKAFADLTYAVGTQP